MRSPALLAFAACLASAVARADAPRAPPVASPPLASSRITGRVFERGSLVSVAAATVSSGGGETASTDDEGRFSLDLAPGHIELTIAAAGYERLHLVEELPPGIARTVEYRLLPTAFGARYRSTVRGAAQHEGERFTLRDEELKQVPGAMGDPFRVIASLPGVIAPIPILPIYAIRGGSPGSNGFFLDGMRVPQLFHLVLVDGVVHPGILDRIDFYPGSYDTTFGHYASGVIDAATRAARTDAPLHGEVELRLFDASLLAETHLPGGVQILAAGRYGFPGPMIHLVQPGVDLSYWDYQLRVDWHGFTLQALGSYDSLRLDLAALSIRSSSGVDVQFLVEFHRLQLRHRFRRGGFELDAALAGGIDRMTILSGQGVQKLSLSARINARLKAGRLLQFAAGFDAEVSRFSAAQFQMDQLGAAPDQLGELAGNRDGIVGGVYAQGTLKLDDLVGMPASITAGVRADVYHAGNVTLLGFDPRILFRLEPLRQLEIFGGFGLYQQPPSFPVPLPGIDTFALQLGLQHALQGSTGIRVKLPQNFSISATGYYSKFDNINDVVIDFFSAGCTSPPPESLSGISAYITRQVKGAAYGLELMARRQSGRVTGWLSYTLSRSERIYSCGLAPSDFDQSHVLNAVVQVRLPWRILVGGRINLSTGRPYTQLSVDLGSMSITGTRNNQRLPTYFQLDLRVDREWVYQKWAFALFVEALNLTYSQSIYGVTFPKDPALMITRYDQPQFEGFQWILPSIGVRGRF